MAAPAIAQQPVSSRLLAIGRRFFRWLTRTHVILSLIMLVLMFVMIVIPLVRMVVTTITY
jgi:hypothetical protein